MATALPRASALAPGRGSAAASVPCPLSSLGRRPWCHPHHTSSVAKAGSLARPLLARDARRVTACSSNAAAALLPLEPQPHQPIPALPIQPAAPDVFEALKRCRALFSCLAFCAVYAFLSWGAPAGPPFAHVAHAVHVTGDTAASGLTSAAKSAWAGLAAGFLHTLCGPDHLAALTPLTIGRNRFAASALGALWGFGHSTGQLILGLVFVVLKDRFHDFVPFLDKWAGTVVALTLIAIGVMGIYESFFEKDHHHADEEQEQVKLALAGGGSVSATSLKAGFATYATGIVYGLQPDALFVVIPALALPTKLAAVAYCTMFVIGTVTAMGGYTLLIGTTSQALIKEQPWIQKHLSTIASGIAICVGVLMLLAGFGFEVPFFS